MTALAERQQLVQWMDAAVQAGARWRLPVVRRISAFAAISAGHTVIA